MTLAEAIRRVLANTEHDVNASEDGDGQTTPEQITDWLDDACKELRGQLIVDVPALYVVTSAESTLTGGTDSRTLDLPEDFARLVRVEQQYGDDWEPVDASDGHAPDRRRLNWREEDGEIVLSPAREAVGVFRLVYHYTPETLNLADDGASLPLPDTLCPVAVEMASAKVARREKADAAPYLAEAERVYARALPALRIRHRQPQPGFRYVEPRSYWRAAR